MGDPVDIARGFVTGSVILEVNTIQYRCRQGHVQCKCIREQEWHHSSITTVKDFVEFVSKIKTTVKVI